MKLYGLKTGLGYYHVVADHPTEAVDKFTKIMTDSNYGFSSQRKVLQIDIIAEAIIDQFITGKTLIL